jgi:hypothetical protein
VPHNTPSHLSKFIRRLTREFATMFKRFRKVRPLRGCGHLGMICLSMCVLFVFNRIIVEFFYQMMADIYPQYLVNPRVEQAVAIIGSLLLLVIQFFLYDLIEDIFSRQR